MKLCSTFFLVLVLLAACGPSSDPSRSLLAARNDRPEISLVNEAVNAYDRGFFSVSRDKWKELLQSYPASPYGPLAAIKTADAFFFGGNFVESLAAYEEFIRLYPMHEAVAYARFQIGESRFLSYKGPQRDQRPLLGAQEAYLALVELNPASEYVPLALRRVEDCQSALADYEVAVTEFYLKQDLYEAAAARYLALREEFPNTQAVSKADRSLQDRFPEDHPLLLALVEKNRLLDDSGEPPEAPLVVASNPNFDSVVRFRLAEPSIPDVVVSEKEEIADEPQIKERNSQPIVKSLKCHTEDDNPFASIILKEGVKQGAGFVSVDGQFVFEAQKENSPGASSEQIGQTRSCNFDSSVKLKVEEFPDRLVITSSGSARAISLDRPKRLIVVVSSENSASEAALD